MYTDYDYDEDYDDDLDCGSYEEDWDDIDDSIDYDYDLVDERFDFQPSDHYSYEDQDLNDL